MKLASGQAMSFTLPSFSSAVDAAKKALSPSAQPQSPAPAPAAPATRAASGDFFDLGGTDPEFKKWAGDIQKKVGERIQQDISNKAPAVTAADVKAGRAGPADVVLRANALAAAGDVENGGRTLTQAGDAFMKAGKYREAEQCFAKMKEPPFADAKTNAARDVDNPATKGGNTTMMGSNSTGVMGKEKFDTTFGKEGDVKLAQCKQLEDMQKVMGRPIDPHNMSDVKAYFQKVSDQNPGQKGAAVTDEYQRYMKNFYVHPGSVRWDDSVAKNDRPGKFNDLLKNQPADDTGRKMVNCEGYMYMTKDILGGIKAPDGKSNRYEIYQAGGVLVNGKPGGHVVSGIYDKTSKQSFIANNDSVENTTNQPLMKLDGNSERVFARYLHEYVRSPFVGKNPADAYDPRIEEKTKDLTKLD